MKLMSKFDIAFNITNSRIEFVLFKISIQPSIDLILLPESESRDSPYPPQLIDTMLFPGIVKRLIGNSTIEHLGERLGFIPVA